ncbi:hypothetical protein FRAHR75_250048 [Frankia sp. Hr75.2]|nr:hypothetical protein FRAHR75_250048 [Frankia sp. Hr75.2]SQD99161.1 hypothetical protein FMEAI12_5130021 [Parafrankia sp. Ea1.12]
MHRRVEIETGAVLRVEQEVREVGDHAAERLRGVRGVDVAVGEVGVLEYSHPSLDGVSENLVALQADLEDVVVESGDLLDDLHYLGICGVRFQIMAVGRADAFDGIGGGTSRLGSEEIELDRVDHFPEDLLLGDEVRVERPVGESGQIADVGHPGMEEAVALEHDAGRIDELAPALTTSAGAPGTATFAYFNLFASRTRGIRQRGPVLGTFRHGGSSRRVSTGSAGSRRNLMSG